MVRSTEETNCTVVHRTPVTDYDVLILSCYTATRPYNCMIIYADPPVI